MLLCTPGLPSSPQVQVGQRWLRGMVGGGGGNTQGCPGGLSQDPGVHPTHPVLCSAPAPTTDTPLCVLPGGLPLALLPPNPRPHACPGRDRGGGRSVEGPQHC